MRIIVFILFFCFSLVTMNVAQCADFYIDASGGSNSNPGTESLPWKNTFLIQSHSVPLTPGDHVKFKRGEVWSDGSLFMDYSGSASQPIVYEAYGIGSKPKIENYGIEFNRQHYVVVKEFEISGNMINDGYAVGLPAGTEFVELRDCDIHQKGQNYWNIAIWIEGGPSALCNNRIINNDIHHNLGTGIGAESFCTTGNENIISGNRIHHNLHQGIELSGKHYIIENNIVYVNGDVTAVTPRGNSGIHIFSDGIPGEGDHNIVRNNTIYQTVERSEMGADGNGILADMWCDDNLIYNNIAYDNDGPGVIIYGGDRNKVYNNTLYNNGRHKGYHVAKAQLAVLDAVDAEGIDSCNVPEGCAEIRDNVVRNNIAYSRETDNFAVLIDLPAKDQNNIFTNNLWFNETSDRPAAIADRDNDPPYLGIPPLLMSEWNGYAWADDTGGDPLFYYALSYDFRLQNSSPAIDAAIDLASEGIVDDFRGEPRPQREAFDIGAFEMHATNIFLFLPALLNHLDQAQ